MLKSKIIFLLFVGLFNVDSFACTSCDAIGTNQESIDRNAWESFAHIFSAIVLSSELFPVEKDKYEIHYRVKDELVFKGDPSRVTKIYTERYIVPLEADYIAIVDCGDPVVRPGDRLIIYANASGISHIGNCNGAKVTYKKGVDSRHMLLETVNRFKKWSQQ